MGTCRTALLGVCNTLLVKSNQDPTLLVDKGKTHSSPAPHRCKQKKDGERLGQFSS